MFSYQKRSHLAKTTDSLFILKDLLQNKKSKWMYVLAVVGLHFNALQKFLWWKCSSCALKHIKNKTQRTHIVFPTKGYLIQHPTCIIKPKLAFCALMLLSLKQLSTSLLVLDIHTSMKNRERPFSSFCRAHSDSFIACTRSLPHSHHCTNVCFSTS